MKGRVVKVVPPKLCDLCYSRVGRKKIHACNDSTNFSNLQSLIDTVRTKLKHQICSSILESDCAEKYLRNRPITLARRAGIPLKVTLNPSNEQKQIISTGTMENIQTFLTLSQNETVGVARIIRAGTCNRKAVEPGLKEILSKRIHVLDQFFKVEVFNFIKVKANKTEDTSQHAVFCNDLGGFITLIKNKRQVTDVHLKFGIDGAGGFLKLCLSIQSIDDDDDNSLIDSGRRKYKDVAISTEFQDSKVKKLFIIGLAQSVQENYHNVFLLWRAIHINEFDGTIATDLKLANILSGLMSHSSQNPCTWCEAQKVLWTSGLNYEQSVT